MFWWICCFLLIAETSHAQCPLKDYPVTDNSAPVIIAGGGLTGLIAAYELQKAGIASIVLEKEIRVGGRVDTIYYPDGATAEAHMEEYWQHTPNKELLDELNVPVMISCPHPSVIIDGKVLPQGGKCGKKYFDSMFTKEESAALKKWNDKTWALYHQLHATFFQGKPMPANLKEFMNISFAEYVKRAALPRKVSEWIRITLEPEISIGWDHISALDGIDESRILLESPEGYGEMNYHVAGGNNGYINALESKLPKGSIRLDARVTKIEQDSNQVIVTYLDQETKTSKTVKGLYALVTVPLFAIEKISFSPPLPKETQQAISTTRFSSYVKIHFRVKREAEKLWQQYGKDGLFTLYTDSELGAIYNATDFEEQLSKDHDLIITLLAHKETAKEWSRLPPDQVLHLAKAKLDKMFPGFSNYITSEQVHQYPTAIAYWPFELKRSRFDDLAVALRKPFDRIQIGGDTTENSHSEGAAQAAIRMSDFLIDMCGKATKN